MAQEHVDALEGITVLIDNTDLPEGVTRTERNEAKAILDEFRQALVPYHTNPTVRGVDLVRIGSHAERIRAGQLSERERKDFTRAADLAISVYGSRALFGIEKRTAKKVLQWSGFEIENE